MVIYWVQLHQNQRKREVGAQRVQRIKKNQLKNNFIIWISIKSDWNWKWIEIEFEFEIEIEIEFELIWKLKYNNILLNDRY